MLITALNLICMTLILVILIDHFTKSSKRELFEYQALLDIVQELC